MSKNHLCRLRNLEISLTARRDNDRQTCIKRDAGWPNQFAEVSDSIGNGLTIEMTHTHAVKQNTSWPAMRNPMYMQTSPIE